jgi:hypothetical protein
LIVRALTGRARIALTRDDLESAGVMIDEALTLAHRSGIRRLMVDVLTLSSEYHARIGQRKRPPMIGLKPAN